MRGGPGRRIIENHLRMNLSWQRKALASSRSADLVPPLNPRIAAFSLPSRVVGPVDCSHGFHR